ncbi:MAG TPA: hypothetical protein VIL68_05845 [Propionibacteriaceae bacterium]
MHDVAADVGPLLDEVEASRAKLAAVRAMTLGWQPGLGRPVVPIADILAILDGPTP